jgi:hypothetical protein
MNLALAEAYLDYLEPLVGIEEGESYRGLLHMMHEKEFVWFVPNDDNRLADGLEVRAEWFDAIGQAMDMGPCSFLEVLIGLSRRMQWFTSESAEGWGWQFLINLGLDRMRDNLSRRKVSQIDDILDSVIFRTYAPDGTGGFFPLTHPKEDQRKVELWYQMSAYVNEIHPEF